MEFVRSDTDRPLVVVRVEYIKNRWTLASQNIQ